MKNIGTISDFQNMKVEITTSGGQIIEGILKGQVAGGMTRLETETRTLFVYSDKIVSISITNEDLEKIS
jgi:hypothetical protein